MQGVVSAPASPQQALDSTGLIDVLFSRLAKGKLWGTTTGTDD